MHTCYTSHAYLVTNCWNKSKMFFSPTEISLLYIVGQFQLSSRLLQQECVPVEPNTDWGFQLGQENDLVGPLGFMKSQYTSPCSVETSTTLAMSHSPPYTAAAYWLGCRWYISCWFFPPATVTDNSNSRVVFSRYSANVEFTGRYWHKAVVASHSRYCFDSRETIKQCVDGPVLHHWLQHTAWWYQIFRYGPCSPIKQLRWGENVWWQL